MMHLGSGTGFSSNVVADTLLAKLDTMQRGTMQVQQISQSVWLSVAMSPEGKPLYSAHELQSMEWSLLQTTGWQLHQPNTLTFLQLFLVEVFFPPCTPGRGPAVPLPYSATSAYAIALAVTSLMSGIFRTYHHSTTALACLVLAERMIAPSAGCASLGSAAAFDDAFGSAAAASLAAATRLPLEQLAPGLRPCVEALDRCLKALRPQ